MQASAAFDQSRQPRGDDHGHVGRREDLGSREPRVAQEELAHLVALDRTAGRHVVLDEEAAGLDEGEDGVPLLVGQRPEPAVHEHEPERPAAVQPFEGVALEQLDVGEPRQALARDRDALGVSFDGDHRTRGLGQERRGLAEGGAHLRDVASCREGAQQRLHLGDRGRAVGQ